MQVCTNRIAFNIIIGYEASRQESESFEKTILTRVSKKFGGCTQYNGFGYWYESATESRESYSGNLAKEKAFNIQVSVESGLGESAYEDLQGIITAAIDLHGIEADWIHVEAQAVQALHFSAQEKICNQLQKNIAH